MLTTHIIRFKRHSPSFVLLLCFTLIFTVGCHTHAWENARAKDTSQAYYDFIKRHPDSPYKSEALSRMEDLAWDDAHTKESAWKYKQFILQYPSSKHLPEALERLRIAEFKAVMKLDATAKSRQEFIAKYPESEESVEVKKALARMAIVDLEYPPFISATGAEPTWHFRIIFHERNGIAAQINCKSITGQNSKQRWSHPSPISGNILLNPNGKNSYSSWVRGESLRGSNTSVSFDIRDSNGHYSSVTTQFILK